MAHVYGITANLFKPFYDSSCAVELRLPGRIMERRCGKQEVSRIQDNGVISFIIKLFYGYIFPGQTAQGFLGSAAGIQLSVDTPGNDQGRVPLPYQDRP